MCMCGSPVGELVAVSKDAIEHHAMCVCQRVDAREYVESLLR